MSGASDAAEDIIEITEEKLDVDNLVQAVTLPYCGAVSTFIGTTRNNFDGKIVDLLEYECYTPMAVKQLRVICGSMRSKWPDIGRIGIVHRLGEVPVCDASVIIAVSSPHRVTAIKATEFCIERLKSSVPIWKREIYRDEESEWKVNKECTWANQHE